MSDEPYIDPWERAQMKVNLEAAINVAAIHAVLVAKGLATAEELDAAYKTVSNMCMESLAASQGISVARLKELLGMKE